MYKHPKIDFSAAYNSRTGNGLVKNSVLPSAAIILLPGFTWYKSIHPGEDWPTGLPGNFPVCPVFTNCFGAPKIDHEHFIILILQTR